MLKFRRKHYESETRTSSLAYGRPSLLPSRVMYDTTSQLVTMNSNTIAKYLKVGVLKKRLFSNIAIEKALNERASLDYDVLIATLYALFYS